MLISVELEDKDPGFGSIHNIIAQTRPHNYSGQIAVNMFFS